MLHTFWHLSAIDLFSKLQSTPSGLSELEAKRRLIAQKRRQGYRPEWWSEMRLLFRQFNNPIVLLLVFAVSLSMALGEYTNAVIIFSILFLTGILGFWQERNAGRAVRRLRALVHAQALVKRDGNWKKVTLEEVVPGDVVRLNAGDLIPGDCFLFYAKDLHVNEGGLTGESFPVEKEVGISAEDAPISARKNVLFQGSNVINGEAEALAVRTAGDTEFSKIAEQIQHGEEETAFELGIRSFGFLLMRITSYLSLGLLVINLLLDKPLVESLLFALALAVGLAPELLPAIVVTTLSAGAIRMAKKKVIVKKLSAIQNLGAIDVLCSDKTGTLSIGEVQVHSTVNIFNQSSDKVRLYAYLNAFFETGFANPLDSAIRQLPALDISNYQKFDEVPYDFIRKRLSIVVEKGNEHWMMTKGALQNVLDVCTQAEAENGTIVPLDMVRPQIEHLFQQQSQEGFRTIGVAYKNVTGDPVINKDDESELIFLGFIFLYDPAKPNIEETVQELQQLGVQLKLITGDNHLAALNLAKQVGFQHPSLLTGADLYHTSDEALAQKASQVQVFAEMEPFQKERVIRALRKGGSVVGYLGDGINDASALKAADVGISVDTAVDVAKEAAGLVLLEKNLTVLKQGILEGRKTYFNTLKYIFITTSANFGNMFSLAGISLVIPFLPLLPAQILLLNFLSDIPAMAIASDRVDEEELAKPRRWNVRLIQKFMVVFGIQSSVFDYLTFGVLLLVFQVGEAYFQTGWFVESAMTEIIILLLIRTRRPFFKSLLSRWLLWLCIIVAGVVILIPYTGIAQRIGFQPLPLPLLLGMISIAFLYGILVEITKSIFFKKNML